jgi:hypothetical protein
MPGAIASRPVSRFRIAMSLGAIGCPSNCASWVGPSRVSTSRRRSGLTRQLIAGHPPAVHRHAVQRARLVADRVARLCPHDKAIPGRDGPSRSQVGAHGAGRRIDEEHRARRGPLALALEDADDDAVHARLRIEAGRQLHSAPAGERDEQAARMVLRRGRHTPRISAVRQHHVDRADTRDGTSPDADDAQRPEIARGRHGIGLRRHVEVDDELTRPQTRRGLAGHPPRVEVHGSKPSSGEQHPDAGAFARCCARHDRQIGV